VEVEVVEEYVLSEVGVLAELLPTLESQSLLGVGADGNCF
jgi:hypothetical protein